MKNKLLLLTTAYFFLILLGMISCERCGPFKDKYKVIELNGNATMLEKVEESEEIYSGTIIDSTTDTVGYDVFGIVMQPIRELYFSTNNKLPRFDLINSAYACSPIEPTTDERIDSLVITSNNDFNTAYPKGTNLAGLFDVVVYDDLGFDDAPASYSHIRLNLNDYLDSRPMAPSFELLLILREQPAVPMDFEFFVQYYQAGIDDDYFEFRTEEVVIQ